MEVEEPTPDLLLITGREKTKGTPRKLKGTGPPG